MKKRIIGFIVAAILVLAILATMQMLAMLESEYSVSQFARLNLSHKEPPEAYTKSFEYKYDGELGGIVITWYKGAFNNGNVLMRHIGTYNHKVQIPEKIDNIPVVGITGTLMVINHHEYGYSEFFVGAFEQSRIAAVYIPDSVTNIGDNAFNECTKLANLTLPDSVTGIGGNAFSSCESLISIEIPDGVTSISDGAFSGCAKLTNITLPDSVTNIEEYAFAWSGITSIEIPDSVTSIGEDAFAYTGLTSFKIPDNVTEVGNGWFTGCKKLTSVIIGDNVTRIGTHSFISCENLTSITIPNSVTSIGMFAFAYTGLTSIEIPDGVESIDIQAFYSCPELTSVTLPDSLLSIDEAAFNNCTKLENIKIPDSVTSISDGSSRSTHSPYGAFDRIPNFTAAYDGKVYISITGENGLYHMPGEFYAAVNGQ